jgi:AcrR family transcriptional regulator
MPRPRFQNIEPTLRDRLLDVAAREMARDGYEGASLNRIIADAGLSKGVFYYYFDDKADLAATVFERALEHAIGSLERFELPSGRFDFWAHLEQLVRATMTDLARTAEHAEVVSRLGVAIMRDPALAARVEPFVVRAMRVSARVWRRGQKLGAVRRDLPPALIAELVRRIKEGLAGALLPANRAPSAAELQRFVTIHLDLVRRLASP